MEECPSRNKQEGFVGEILAKMPLTIIHLRVEGAVILIAFQTVKFGCASRRHSNDMPRPAGLAYVPRRIQNLLVCFTVLVLKTVTITQTLRYSAGAITSHQLLFVTETLQRRRRYVMQAGLTVTSLVEII